MADSSAGGRKRKCAAAGLGDLHDDVLERVLARLPPSSYFRLRRVSRRWRAAAESATFRAACARVPARDPWLLMLPEARHDNAPDSDTVVFDTAEGAWARWRGAPGPVPVASAGGLVLYRDPASGALTVANPLTGASRVLPPCAAATAPLLAVAMYGAPYRVVLILGDLPDLSVATFDSSANAWDEPVALARKPAASPDHRAADDAVYFLSKSGDVVSTTMHRTASRQHSCAVSCTAAVAYFLSQTGTVVACDLARRCFAELPRVLPAYHEYSVDVVACGDAAYAVVLSEFLGATSLRVWEFAAGDGEWRQAAAMPPAMAHAFLGAKADVNCVGHGGRVVVCVSGAGGCFVCDVGTNRWEELPRRADFVAAVSFEPRMEAAV